MLVSEIAHSLKSPNNKALRENLKLLIIHKVDAYHKELLLFLLNMKYLYLY